MRPMNKVHSLYNELLGEFGSQNWWPAKTQYEVVVGALLTQNTNWKNAGKAIANLKEAKSLSPKKILGLKARPLESLIKPSGFYRQKAKRLKALTEKFIEIKKRRSPPTREELLQVNGVGKETADSILLYAFDLPYFVIDAYTRRFCAHHSLFGGAGSCGKGDAGYDDYRRFFESSLPRSVPLYKEYHALIVEWGKRNGNGKKKEQ